MATAAPQDELIADLMGVFVQARIPDFWMDEPHAWFIRVEAMLASHKLSDDAKFDIAVGKLPQEVITLIKDFLAEPPATEKFHALKTKLLNIYEDFKSREIENALIDEMLGDQKPSQLLQRMRNLAKDKIHADTLRLLWQTRLPYSVRAELAGSGTKDLDSLAVIADNVVEATGSSHVSEVAHKTQDQDQYRYIIDELAQINFRLNNIERTLPNGRFGRFGRSASED